MRQLPFPLLVLLASSACASSPKVETGSSTEIPNNAELSNKPANDTPVASITEAVYPFVGTDLDRNKSSWSLRGHTLTFAKKTVPEPRQGYIAKKTTATVSFTDTSGRTATASSLSYWENPGTSELAIDFDTLHLDDLDQDGNVELYFRWNAPRAGYGPNKPSTGVRPSDYIGLEAGVELETNRWLGECKRGHIDPRIDADAATAVQSAWGKLAKPVPELPKSKIPAVGATNVMTAYRWGKANDRLLIVEAANLNSRRLRYYAYQNSRWDSIWDEKIVVPPDDGDIVLGVDALYPVEGTDDALISYHAGTTTDASEMPRHMFQLSALSVRQVANGSTSFYLEKKCNAAELLVAPSIARDVLHVRKLNDGCKYELDWLPEFAGCD